VDWVWGSKLMKRKILVCYEMLGRDSMLVDPLYRFKPNKVNY